ncbi:unnamed protein product [Lampetra fluviatilis]
MAWPCVNRACCLARCWNQLDVDDISIPLTHATFAEESLLPPANEAAAAAAANSGGGHPGPGHPHPHQHHHQQQGLGVSAGGGGGDAAAAAAAAARETPEKPSSRGASRSVTRSDYKAWRRVPREPSCKPRREYLPPEDPFSNDTQYKADFRVWPLHRREKPQWGHHHHDQLQQQQQLLPHQQHHGQQQQQQDSVYTRLLGEDGTGRDGGGMMGPAGDGEGEPLVKKHGAESTALLAMAREVCIMPVQGTTRPDARRQETSPRRKRVAPASSSSPESRRPRTPTATATAPRRDLSSRAGPPPARHSRSPGPPPAAAAVVEKGGGDGAGAPGGGRGRRGSSRRGRKSGSQENDAAGPAAGGTATTRAGSESPRPVRRPPRAAGPGFESGLGSGSGSGPGPGPGEAAAVAAPRRAIEIPCGRPVARGGAGAAKSVTFGERAAEEEAAARGARGAGTSERRQKRNDGEAPTRETDTGATTGVAGPGSGPGDLPGGAAVGGAANAAGAGSGQGSAAGGRASLLIGASDCKRQSVSHGERGRARDLEKRLRHRESNGRGSPLNSVAETRGHRLDADRRAVHQEAVFNLGTRGEGTFTVGPAWKRWSYSQTASSALRSKFELMLCDQELRSQEARRESRSQGRRVVTGSGVVVVKQLEQSAPASGGVGVKALDCADVLWVAVLEVTDRRKALLPPENRVQFLTHDELRLAIHC